MTKKFVVPLKEAVTGTLHGGNGTYRILIDKDISGAKNFSLLVNTSKAGTKGAAHKHDVEHCWYILSGTGNMVMGEPIRSDRKWRYLPLPASCTASMSTLVQT